MKQPIALIIARGGSKRLPRKNVLPFCGKPLVEWSILQAICSHSIGCENTYLSTDDDEIAAIGEKHKISIIWRPDWPNPDELTGTFVIRHATKEILRTRNFNTIVNIIPTSPVRFPDDMDRIIKRYIELKKKYQDCDEVSWAIRQKETYIWKYLDDNRACIWMYNKKGYFAIEGCMAHIHNIEAHSYQYGNVTTDQEFDNSNDWMKPGKVGRSFYIIEAQWFQQFDIDNRDEFDLCEFLMEKHVLKGRGEKVYTEYRDG